MKINLLALKQNNPHFPVMIQEIMNYLLLPLPSLDPINYLNNMPIDDSQGNNIYMENSHHEQIFLDCTFGAGGYSKVILENTQAKVIALDRDKTVEPYAQKLIELYPKRFTFVLSKFSNFDEVLKKLKITALDGIIMDLGISTMQINNGNRGFSFKEDNYLSMEMGLNQMPAYDFINKANEKTLADVIHYYGEEIKARQIAKNIVIKRNSNPIKTAKELANVIMEITGKGAFGKIHPATKTFQAIRIYINDELKELQIALKKSLKYLKHQGQSPGRLLVVSFHSLEDRIVKDFFNDHGKVKKKFDKDNFNNITQSQGKFTLYKLNDPTLEIKDYLSDNLLIINKKPIVPTSQEIKINPPSSSAKLRVALKL
ncbi:16S rRNA (cytosine(1402)-N(4))-methyltransferase RsmH [Candidatus Hepatincolaceae symbiont of Richtersius coronifer]